MDAATPGEQHRTRITRPDGRVVSVARLRGQLFVCATGCCCGRTGDGFPPSPRSSTTTSGSGGGSATSFISRSLQFDGHALWFHSINADPLVLALYDHIEAMLRADGRLSPPPSLARYQFSGSR